MRRTTALSACLFIQFISVAGIAQASRAGGTPGGCGSATGPDVIVGDLVGWMRFNPVGNIGAWTMGTTSCNFGDQVLPWIAYSNLHPVIATNAYRLKGGRFEQIGMSWVKHGWGASAENACCTCINPQNFEALGVGCSDPYDAGTNSIQGGFMNNGHIVAGLGPRSDINPYTGAFDWPYTTYGQSGDTIYKRLQIVLNDVNPALNAGALYFAECEYVTPNDAAAGNNYNNASYRQFTVGSATGGSWLFNFSSQALIHRESPAIQAWQDQDPQVLIQTADVPGDGRFYLGCRVSNNGNGTWHYEYAVWNMHSDRCAGSFTLPIHSSVVKSNFGFHDVFYHSGEPYDGTDWTQPQTQTQGQLTWTTATFASNPNANALRWGTLYNFRLDANTPPHGANVTLGLFKPGSPLSILIGAKAPSRLGDTNGDDAVNIDDLVAVITGWGRCPAPPTACPGDLDGNGVVNIDDLVRVITNWG